MDLWIRSQDKEVLTICRDLSIGGFENSSIIADAGCSIGTYKTKERALEVLDEIQEILEQILDANLTVLPVFVYNMPEE